MATDPGMVRLRRTSPDQPGWSRRRAGRGFVYLDESGARLSEEDARHMMGVLNAQARRGDSSMRRS